MEKDRHLAVVEGWVLRDAKFGPYNLIHQIASGGMAEVYLAKTLGLAGFEKLVAIKLIHPNFCLDEQFIEMLINEAKLTVQLQHVNIAQTFDLGRVGDTYYLTMEYVEGADLYQLLRRSSELGIQMPISAAAHVAHEIAVGLDYAHRKRDRKGNHLGIVHRDISPQNVLISRAGEVKLVDFGIAKASQRAQETQVGVIKGKYYYMSPEQAWGDRVDARTDLFSTGIVLYEMLAGQMLYYEEDLHKLLDRVRKADISMPSNLREGIPTDLEQITMRALRKRPEDRFQTAAALSKDLQRFLNVHTKNHAATDLTEWSSKILASLNGEHDDFATQNVSAVRALSKGELKDDNSIIVDLGSGQKPTRITTGNHQQTRVTPPEDPTFDSSHDEPSTSEATVPLSRPEVAAAAEKIRRQVERAEIAARSPAPPNMGSASTQLAALDGNTAITPVPWLAGGQVEVPDPLDQTTVDQPRSHPAWPDAPLGTAGGLQVDIVGSSTYDGHPIQQPVEMNQAPSVQQMRHPHNPALYAPESYPVHTPAVPFAPAPAHPPLYDIHHRIDEASGVVALDLRKKSRWWIWTLLALGVVGLILLAQKQPEPPAKAPFTLEILSSPPGAQVTVNGQKLAAATPTNYPDAAPDVEYTVELSAPGHSSETRKVKNNARLFVMLKRNLVQLRITSEPSGATVYMNQQPQGQTPLVLPDIDPSGTTAIELRLKGHRPHYQELTWSLDEREKDLPITMKPGKR